MSRLLSRRGGMFFSLEGDGTEVEIRDRAWVATSEGKRRSCMIDGSTKSFIRKSKHGAYNMHVYFSFPSKEKLLPTIQSDTAPSQSSMCFASMLEHVVPAAERLRATRE